MTNRFFERVKVVAGATVTLVVALAVAVPQFAEAVAPALPDGWQDNALTIGATAAAWLGGAVLIIRRVTEVSKALRGLLPPDTDA